MPPRPEQVLKEYFGYDSFRPFQGMLVNQVLSGCDVLGVMPTGAGKSLVYQVPALILKGTTIVISPLVSLMKDQVDALRQSGVAAALVNSTLAPDEREFIYQLVEQGHIRLLYVAPERLGDPRFVRLCQQIEIPLVAVDEAHCVSQWGNDFRPSYGSIAGFIAGLPVRPVVAALTATATETVRDDIASSLKLHQPQVCVAGFDRQNLYLGVVRPDPAKKQATLMALIRQRAGQFGIVYCSTRRTVEEVAALLGERGISTTIYHAGLSDDQRRQNQDDFLFDRRQVMVATNAFGMGIDKSNIGFVIHYNMPRDLESYYQEAGRAGRDGSPADCLLIYNAKDVQTVNYFAERGHQDRQAGGMDTSLSSALYARDLDRIRKMTAYCKTTDCLRSYILRYFGESDTPYRCEHCSSCAAESQMLDITAEAHRVIACVLELAALDRSLGRVMLIDILRGSASQAIMRAGYDKLPSYASLRETPKTLLHTVFDALAEQGCLKVAVGKYPVISCTEQGYSAFKSGEKFEAKVAKAKTQPEHAAGGADSKVGVGGATGADAGAGSEARAGSRNAAATPDSAAADDVDEVLLQKLKNLRFEIAQREKLPAYIIFHNSTLKDMCVKKPRTLAEFLQVSGVGQRKAELYAEQFLACLNS